MVNLLEPMRAHPEQPEHRYAGDPPTMRKVQLAVPTRAGSAASPITRPGR